MLLRANLKIYVSQWRSIKGVWSDFAWYCKNNAIFLLEMTRLFWINPEIWIQKIDAILVLQLL